MIEGQPIRVLVVDDHELVRAGLAGVLDADPSIEVVAEAADGVQAVAAVEVHRPDVVVMDLQMPGMGGIEATRRILAAQPRIAVLVLTMFDDDDSVFAALRAGAHGYLLKGSRRDELRAAVIGVATKQAVFGSGVAARVLERMAGRRDREDVYPELTPRELQVLEHLVGGLRPGTISQKMGIADKTVRNNISSILTKLHVADRATAIAQARRAGVGQQRRSELRYVVVTDLEGSTKLAGEFGDAYPTILTDHHRIVTAALTRHGGACFGTTGDTRVASFREPWATINASLDVHRDLAAHPFPAGAEVRVRIGIHLGAVIEHHDELVGLTAHETARVAAVGAGGRIIITEAALPPDPQADLRFTDLGEKKLPDVDRPLRLFLVVSRPPR